MTTPSPDRPIAIDSTPGPPPPRLDARAQGAVPRSPRRALGNAARRAARSPSRPRPPIAGSRTQAGGAASRTGAGFSPPWTVSYASTSALALGVARAAGWPARAWPGVDPPRTAADRFAAARLTSPRPRRNFRVAPAVFALRRPNPGGVNEAEFEVHRHSRERARAGRARRAGAGAVRRGVRRLARAARAATSRTKCCRRPKRSTGSRIAGGILGSIAGSAAGSVGGLLNYVPVAAFTDQITASIACRLDPEEQEQAADATLEATRGADESAAPEVGQMAAWTSDTREDVSGTSTVVASNDGRRRRPAVHHGDRRDHRQGRGDPRRQAHVPPAAGGALRDRRREASSRARSPRSRRWRCSAGPTIPRTRPARPSPTGARPRR